MNFLATEDQIMVQQMVRRFAVDHLAPHAIELAHASSTIDNTLPHIQELGLKGARASFAHEGSEMDAMSETFILEELARHDAGLAIMLGHHNLGALLLDRLHDPTTRDFTTGTRWLGIHFTQDALISSRVISTHLDFVPGGVHLTDILLVGHTQCVLLDITQDRTRITPQLDALGMRASSPASITFNEAPSNLISGDPSHIMSVIRSIKTLHHVQLAAVATGLAQAAHDVSASYAYERKQFGRRLTDFQVTQFKLANMATRLQCARHLCYLATTTANTHDGLRHALNAHACAVKAAAFITDEGVQLHGGYGYTSEYPIERYYRDSVTLQSIGGKLHEVQRQAGALLVGERPS